MPLTDVAIRNAKHGEKPVRLYDDGGMYLEIVPVVGGEADHRDFGP